MPFPPVERVKYMNPPLDNVICQLRFPAILLIDSQIPYEFQDRIRKEFPIYEEKVEVQQEINASLNTDFQKKIENPITKITSNKNYEFRTEESDWTINLTRTFLSITTKNYSTWEEFCKKLQVPLKSVLEIYKPAYFSRVGLRYIDVFCKSRIGLEEYDWKDLIQPYFLGLLGSDVSNSVGEQNSVSEILCEDGSSIIRIATQLVKRIDNGETCFLLDSDVFSTKKINVEEVEEKLEFLHDRSSRLVRYVIKDLLHFKMEPVNI